METLWNIKWQLIASAEFLVILALFIKLKRSNVPTEMSQLKRYKKSDLSMDNVMQDLHLSGQLYKTLSRKYHPDKFIGTMNIQLADEIFKLIQQNKGNYNELLAIEKRAELELKLD
jgi:hypothetical protein